MSARWALATDTGLEREVNEDCARVIPERGLYAIADGMGGHVAGEVASRVAVDSALEFLEQQAQPDEEALGRSQNEANAAVIREAARRGLHGMGTTLTLLYLRDRNACVSHVGDTRVYVLNQGELELMTRDHTLVGALVQSGLLSREAARLHPERHVLIEALGTQDEVDAQVLSFEVPSTARLLMSTDGLHDLVPHEELCELASIPDLEAAAAALIERANQNGGPDNITVILVEP